MQVEKLTIQGDDGIPRTVKFGTVVARLADGRSVTVEIEKEGVVFHQHDANGRAGHGNGFTWYELVTAIENEGRLLDAWTARLESQVAKPPLPPAYDKTTTVPIVTNVGIDPASGESWSTRALVHIDGDGLISKIERYAKDPEFAWTPPVFNMAVDRIDGDMFRLPRNAIARMTDRARQGMAGAAVYAGDGPMRTHDLLRSLAKANGGVAEKVLDAIKFDLNSVRLDQQTLDAKQWQLDEDEMGLPKLGIPWRGVVTSNVYLAIQDAWTTMATWGHNYLGTEHLLIGLAYRHFQSVDAGVAEGIIATVREIYGIKEKE